MEIWFNYKVILISYIIRENYLPIISFLGFDKNHRLCSLNFCLFQLSKVLLALLRVGAALGNGMLLFNIMMMYYLKADKF